MAKSKRLKKKHNKKRNTAFLYEVLVRELTKTVLAKDAKRQKAVVEICKEHFRKGTLLYREKELYSAILETSGVAREVADRLLREAKEEHDKLDERELFVEQTSLITKINKSLAGSPFINFVPDYKNLASVAQIFSKSAPIKDRVLLEQTIVERMCASPEDNKKEEMKTIDSLTYKTFIKKFNEQYGDSLLEEQKELITKYVMSFVDNGVELKYYLNEEIGRLKEGMQISIGKDKVLSDDEYMERKAGMVLGILEGMKRRPIDEEMVSKILKVQELISETREIQNDS